MEKSKPIAALSKCFRLSNQPLVEFQQELKNLKASCPDTDTGKSTCYRTFVNEVGAFLGVEIDWTETPTA